jgi:gluconokinase
MVAQSLFVTFGLPGAGKTYAARLFERFGYYVHDGDDDLPEEMRQRIATQQPLDDHLRDTFFARIIAHTHELHPRYPHLVVAQTFIKEKYRLRFLSHFPHARFILIEAQEPIRISRLVHRTHQPLDPAYAAHMVTLFEPPHIPHLRLNNDDNGDHHLEQQIAQLVSG